MGTPSAGGPVEPKAPAARTPPAAPAIELSQKDFADYMLGSGKEGRRGAPGPMAPVPAGRFSMGSAPQEGNRNERPKRSVYLDAFHIDLFEVTVEEYARCVEAGACGKPGDAGRCNWNWPERARHPINCVSWEQARRYCAWAGKRLPTEAEWEKAARGTDGRRFPWGDEAPDAGGVHRMNGEGSADGYEATAPAGSFARGAGPYGELDLAGNVAEWTADWFDAGYYEKAPERGPAGPATGELKTVRGGSWFSASSEARTAARVGYAPGVGLDLVGFRCAAAAPPKPGAEVPGR